LTAVITVALSAIIVVQILLSFNPRDGFYAIAFMLNK
jgi:hypothetical protein